jgi:autotransporter family porin
LRGQWWRGSRPALAGAIVVAVVAAAIGGVWLVRRHASATQVQTATLVPAASPTGSAPPTPTDAPSPTPTATPSPSPSPAAIAVAAASGAGAPAHFTTLAPGSALPADAQCAAWVRARPLPENKRGNAGFDQAAGHRLGAAFFPTSDDARANTPIGARVDGAFTGTTQEVLRWAACKWGVDEDLVYAQAAKESWWRQSAKGDFGTDPTACPPGHGLGVDGQPGKCPQSYGILQNRYPFELTSWPGISSSTAMNADTAYAIWRVCYEGYEHWLNDVERGAQYGAGDAWGCVGRWFAGRWHIAPADQYVAAVQGYQSQRIWQTANFQEP